MKKTCQLFKILLLGSLLTLAGCRTTDPILFSEGDAGAKPEDLIEAADTQDTSIGVINTEATSIQQTSPNKSIQTSAANILAETPKLEDIADLLRREAESNTHVAQLQERVAELQQKIDSGEARMMLWIKILGIICVPAGLGIAYFTKSLKPIAFCVMGVVLMISTQLDQFVTKYGAWFIWLGVAVGAYVTVSVLRDSQKSLFGATRVGEALKEHMKEKDPEFVKQLFGEGTKPGSVSHDVVTERQIRATRKQIHKMAAPVAG